MAKKMSSKNGSIGVKQTFTITAPGAVSVQLMGDFTHWQKHPISMGDDGGTGARHASLPFLRGWRVVQRSRMHTPRAESLRRRKYDPAGKSFRNGVNYFSERP